VLIATDGVFSMDGVIANLKASIWRINTTRW
jgi:7-keto-8-aminopelargonate synthetase-like enzyme